MSIGRMGSEGEWFGYDIKGGEWYRIEGRLILANEDRERGCLVKFRFDVADAVSVDGLAYSSRTGVGLYSYIETDSDGFYRVKFRSPTLAKKIKFSLCTWHAKHAVYCCGRPMLRLDRGVAGVQPVYLTFDVENNRGTVPYFIDGGGRGDLYTTRWIMECLEERGFRGVFFVNVFEHNKYTSDSLRDLTVEIGRRGHEVGLHNHYYHVNPPPGSSYDFYREDLFNYDLEGQFNIIKYGSDLIREWTGVAPKSFRAGSFKVNGDTYVALSRLGFSTDSSLVFRSRYNKDIDHATVNNTELYNGVRVYPVSTCFNKTLDIEGHSGAGLIESMECLRNQGAECIVVIGHSFSFLRRERCPPGVSIVDDIDFHGLKVTGNDYRKADEFIALLDYLKYDNRYKVATFTR